MNIRELALVDISAPPRRMGQSPEKLQIFLCYSPIPFCAVWELKPLTIVPHPQGLEFIFAVFEDIVWCSFPLGKVGMGLADGKVRTPGNSEPTVTGTAQCDAER